MNFCNISEQFAGNRGVRRLFQWPRNHVITWHVTAAPSGLTVSQCKDIYSEAFEWWMAVCGVQYKYVPQARQANLLIGTRRIDGPAGVLAEAELPPPGTTASSQFRAWADNSDRWTDVDSGWEGTGRFPLRVVMAHEFGHSSGLGHNTDGRTNALMDPQVSHITRPQEWDAEEMVARYGEASEGGGEDGSEGDEYDRLAQVLASCLRRNFGD